MQKGRSFPPTENGKKNKIINKKIKRAYHSESRRWKRVETDGELLRSAADMDSKAAITDGLGNTVDARPT